MFEHARHRESARVLAHLDVEASPSGAGTAASHFM